MVYLDVMLIAGKIMEETNMLKTKMARKFDMKDIGVAKIILGMKIPIFRKNGKLKLSQ